jgi:hypothetical protein
MRFYVWPLPALPVILAFRFQQQLALTLVLPFALLGSPALHCTGILKRRGAVVQHLRFRGFAPGGGLAARGKPTTGQGRGLGASHATGGYVALGRAGLQGSTPLALILALAGESALPLLGRASGTPITVILAPLLSL